MHLSRTGTWAVGSNQLTGWATTPKKRLKKRIRSLWRPHSRTLLAATSGITPAKSCRLNDTHGRKSQHRDGKTEWYSSCIKWSAKSVRERSGNVEPAYPYLILCHVLTDRLTSRPGWTSRPGQTEKRGWQVTSKLTSRLSDKRPSSFHTGIDSGPGSSTCTVHDEHLMGALSY